MTYWFMYWFTRLDSFIAFLEFTVWLLVIPGVVLAFIAFINGLMEEENPLYHFIRHARLTLGWTSLVIVFSFVSCFVPTTKEAAAIYLIPKIANSQAIGELSKLPDNLAKLLNAKAEEWLNDTLNIKDKEEAVEKKGKDK